MLIFKNEHATLETPPPRTPSILGTGHKLRGGGYKTGEGGGGGGACEVVQKGGGVGVEKVLAMLKGGTQKVLG